MGGKLGTIFARAGHEVVFSYARSKEKLKKRGTPRARQQPPRRVRPRRKRMRYCSQCTGRE
jgi:hypothetical protein